MAENPINSNSSANKEGEFDFSSILFDNKLSSTSKSTSKNQDKRKRTTNKAVKEPNHTITSAATCPDPHQKMDSSMTNVGETSTSAEMNDEKIKDDDNVSMAFFKSEMVRMRSEMKDVIIDSIQGSFRKEKVSSEVTISDDDRSRITLTADKYGHGVKRKRSATQTTSRVDSRLFNDLSSSDDDTDISKLTQKKYKIPKSSHQHKNEGSENSDNFLNQIDELLQEKQISDKDSDFEESLEQEYNLKDKVGAEINPKVANIVTNLFINNKSKENITDILDRYLRPGNLEIQLPEVNGEIWAFMKSGTCTKDIKFQKLGNKIVKCTYAVTNLTDQLLQIKKKLPDVNQEMTEAIKKAMDSLTLLGSVFKDLNQKRRDTIKIDLNQRIKPLAYPSNNVNNGTSKNLFGEDLGRKLRDLKDTNQALTGPVYSTPSNNYGYKFNQSRYGNYNNRQSTYSDNRNQKPFLDYHRRPQSQRGKGKPTQTSHKKK